MSITLSRKDIIWGYFAQFFSIAAGIITLPLILHMLTAEEIGMNYLMLTVGSLVSLFDFGFAPQFGRNITYIFSGSQKLKKEGIDVERESRDINYRLLATMIHTARSVYRLLGLIVLTIMLTLGSLYIYKVTNGFTNINNSLTIWVIYSISTFLNIYYSYYTSLLTGKGLIMESRKVTVYSKLAYVILTFAFLYSGLGLLGVVFASLIAPLVNRYISYRFFFTSEIIAKISAYEISKKEKIELFKIIWHNAKKLGLVFVGGYSISKLSMFLSGLFLSLSEVASFGLMNQLFILIMTFSSTLFNIYQPRYSALRVEGNNNLLVKEFAFSMNIYYILYFLGSICILFFGSYLLTIIGSKAVLPSFAILAVYSLVIFLEGNHSNYSTLIVTNNNVPFVKASLITGTFIAFGSYISLAYTSSGILGLVLVQGLSQLAYSNWKWPLMVCKEFNINFLKFVTIGINESISKLKTHLHGI